MRNIVGASFEGIESVGQNIGFNTRELNRKLCTRSFTSWYGYVFA